MKYLITILLVAVGFNDLDRIAKVNKIKKEAKEAYNTGDYKSASEKYSFLLDSMKVQDDNVRLNLANAYYQLRDTTNALNGYNDLIGSSNRVVKSVAHQQLGVMSNRDKNLDQAIAHFKNALKANPNNEDARYNYELLKKIKEKKDKEDQNKDQQQNQDQNKQDQDQQQQKEKNNEKEGDPKEEENSENKDSENKDGDQKEKESGEEKEDKEGEDSEQKKEGKESDEDKKDKEKQQKEGEESKDEKGEEDKSNPKDLGKQKPEKEVGMPQGEKILQQYREKEIKYLQQRKRKATKKRDKTKPDW